MNKTLRTLFRSALALGVVAGLTAGAQAQTSVGTLGSGSHTITTDTTWTTAGSPYTLNTIVYVTSGADLTINPGVVIRGVSDAADGNTSNNNPGTLVITRGSKIFANGTSSLPIVFTDVTDDAVNGSAGTGSYAGVNNISGTTGGVILLGKTYTATSNAQDVTNPGNVAPVATDGGQIEGLTLLNLGRYGGNAVNVPNSGDAQTLSDDNDDSGSMSYWSIRYGGEIIGTSNEINGFTLGAVGRQTDISHIEIVNALDDGIEFFGGTVNTKYITVFHSGDDSVDYDEGFRGKMQYYFIMQGGMTTTIGSGASDRIGEWDGANNGDDNVPFSVPTIYNATFIGRGGPNEGAGTTDVAGLVFTDGAGGRVFNSIIMNTQGGFIVEDTAVARDSYAKATTLYSTATANSAWVDAQNGNAPMYDHDPEGANLLDMGQVAAWNVGTIQPTSGTFGSFSGTPGASLGWVGTKIIDLGATTGARPIAAITMASMPNPLHGFETVSIDPRATNSATSTTRSAPEDGFFDQAAFKGAFGPNYNWMEGWSLLDTIGVITSPANAAPASASPSFRFAVTFNSTSGASYLVQASSSPSSGFSTIGSVVGTGSSVTVIDERALSTRQFYQVVQQ